MKTKFVTITPDVARKVLELNTNNRPLNKSHIAYLADEMSQGRWKANGDTICVSKTKLIDGQHRLHAVLKSGVPIQALIVEDVPDDVFATKDCGKRRSSGEALALIGETNYCTLAAAAGVVNRYVTNRMGFYNSGYSPAKIVELVEEYGDDLRESVRFSISLKTKQLVHISLMAGLHYVFSRFDRDAADEFWTSLIDGSGLSSTSPIFVLRERLRTNQMGRSKLSRLYISAICIKAWNAYRDGKSISILKFNSGEDFPVAK